LWYPVLTKRIGEEKKKGSNEGTYRRTQRSPAFSLAEILEMAAMIQRWARSGAVTRGLDEQKMRIAIDAVWWKEV